MSSHARVKKYKVRKAVAAMIKENIANNKEWLENTLRFHMNEQGWKIFRPKTREDAIKKIKDNQFLNSFSDTEGKRISYQLRPILAMCDMSEDDCIMLSKEDCATLHKYFD